MRSIIHVLSTELFGRSLVIRDFPRRRDLTGLGMSDSGGPAKRLARRLGYTNTFFDCEPRFDICRPAPEQSGTLDFMISSDVFEHVAPPVQAAFDNARRMLKPRGILVFSVPQNMVGDTIEHFPELHDYGIVDRGDRRVLVNRTVDGREQMFEDLVFHGGPGATLEMRVFARDDLLANFAAAGFETPRVYGEEVADFGIVWGDDPSLTMGIRAPMGVENDVRRVPARGGSSR